MEVEDPLIKRWRELGYCPVIELAKDMGITLNSCYAKMRKALKYKVYSSKMNYL